MSNVPTLLQRVMAAHPLMEVLSPPAMAVPVRDSAMVPLQATALQMNLTVTTVPVGLSTTVVTVAPLEIPVRTNASTCTHTDAMDKTAKVCCILKLWLNDKIV